MKATLLLNSALVTLAAAATCPVTGKGEEPKGFEYQHPKPGDSQ